MKFWETERYKDAHLSKLQLPNETLEKLLEWVKKDKDILLFMGNPGVGKSYFIAAFIHSLIESKKNFRFFTEEELFQRVRETISKGWDYNYDLNIICESPYLIIDDLGRAAVNEHRKEVMTNIIDMRYNQRLPTIITSNFFLKDIKQELDPRVHSRLASKDNCLIELNWIDKRLQD